ncbi:hypothetical protein, partial [Prevotella histicola]|uniref:hypothetical protein n=1 Tax=Prevotella histicola TaxID=470565 RepID=UPI0028893410
ENFYSFSFTAKIKRGLGRHHLLSPFFVSEGLGEAALRAWAVPSEQSLHFLPLIFYSSSPTLLFLSL